MFLVLKMKKVEVYFMVEEGEQNLRSFKPEFCIDLKFEPIF